MKIILFLIITTSIFAVEFENIRDDYWLCKSKASNILIVEEDSTITMVGVPSNIEETKEINTWIAQKFKKELGQLIISDDSMSDDQIRLILNPMVTHSFSSIIEMIAPSSLATQSIGPIEFGNFIITDATPRLSIMYPGIAFSKSNLIVFSNDDKVAYFGNILTGENKLQTGSESKILSWKRSLESALETIDADYYIPYRGDNYTTNNYNTTVSLLNKK